MSKVSTSSLVKFTFASHPRQKALRGTLGFEVNFTGRDNPRQKGLRGRLGNLVKLTLPGIAIKSFSFLHKDFLKKVCLPLLLI